MSKYDNLTGPLGNRQTAIRIIALQMGVSNLFEALDVELAKLM
jgi:hypothetical protein